MGRGASYRPSYANNAEQPQNWRGNRSYHDHHHQYEEPPPSRPLAPPRSRQVDSWRSYANDSTNLQTSTSQYAHTFNAAARSFQPAPEYSLAAPASTAYQSPFEARAARYNLRSNVPRGQTASQPAWRATPREPLRAAQTFQYSTVADQVLPSIESIGENQGFRPQNQSSSSPRRILSRKSTPYREREVAPPPAPVPTKTYLRTASLQPSRRTVAQKLLVILDLNGTLLVRPNRKVDPTKFTPRPGVHALLNYLFENHIVMVWSSARPTNAGGILDKLLTPERRSQLAAVWARDKLGLNLAQYNAKVQVYKKLGPIWADAVIRTTAGEKRHWDQTNTILVDDSILKGLAQPHNLLQVPEFKNYVPRQPGSEERNAWQEAEEQILKSLEQKLEELKWQDDVSKLIHKWHTGEKKAPGVVDETVDTNAQGAAVGEEEGAGSNGRHYPTPKSPTYSPEPAARRDDNDDVKRRSVSPIDASVFRDLLRMDDKESKSKDEPATPKSLEDDDDRGNTSDGGVSI